MKATINLLITGLLVGKDLIAAYVVAPGTFVRGDWIDPENGRPLLADPRIRSERIDFSKPKAWKPPVATITLKDLCTDHQEGFIIKHLVKDLDDITYEFSCENPVAVMGDPRQGKSALMRVMSGVDAPASGSVKISGDRKAVFLTRGFSNEEGKTVWENVRAKIAANSCDKRPSSIDRMTERILDIAELNNKLLTKARELSGGEVSRFALAMGLAKGTAKLQPPVIFFDDFVDHIDDRIRIGLASLMKKLSKVHGVGIVFSSHTMYAILEIASLGLHVQGGHIIQADRPINTIFVKNLVHKNLAPEPKYRSTSHNH